MTTQLESAMASLRSALPDDSDDHGHVVVESDAVREVLAALSTPTADYVREALAEMFFYAEAPHARWKAGHEGDAAEHLYQNAYSRADDALALVRPRGTVTDDVREAASLPLAPPTEWGWRSCIVCGSDAVTDRDLSLLLIRGVPTLVRLGWCDSTQECRDDFRVHGAQGLTSLLTEAVDTYEVRPHGTVTPTVEEWSAQMDAERARQIERGYDDAHDAQHGVAHLLNWAIDYARRGNNLAAATMARCALRMPRGTVTDAEVEAAARAMYEEHGEWAWSSLTDSFQASYISDARAALEAAAKVRPREMVTEDAREAEMRELHHFEVEQQLAETIAIVKRAQAAVLRHEHTPASLHMDQILNEVNTEIPSEASVGPRRTATDTSALARAWDEGFNLATRNNPSQPHPLAQSNPYRGEARS